MKDMTYSNDMEELLEDLYIMKVTGKSDVAREDQINTVIRKIGSFYTESFICYVNLCEGDDITIIRKCRKYSEWDK